MFRRRSSIGLLLAGLLLSALPAGGLAQSPDVGPEGVDWRLIAVAGSGVPLIDVPPGVDATLRIDGGRAGGDGGCNGWFGDVTIDGAAIAFSGIGSTMMACEEPAMSFEGQFLGSLDDVAGWAITGGRLELADAAGAVLLVFSADEAVAIEGVEWTVTQLLDDAQLALLPEDVQVTLQLLDGQAAGNAGCNRYFGTYVLQGESLTFGPMAATEMACPEPRMTIEGTWLTTLGTVTGWTSIDGQLQLVDGSGGTVAVLEPRAGASVVGSWTLAALGDAGGVVGMVADSVAGITLGDDGLVTGDTGCNILNGDYAVDGAAITFGPIATTRRACVDEGAAATEAQLLASLEAAAGWRITVEGWLELTDASGTLLAGFTPAIVAAG